MRADLCADESWLRLANASVSEAVRMPSVASALLTAGPPLSAIPAITLRAAALSPMIASHFGAWADALLGKATAMNRSPRRIPRLIILFAITPSDPANHWRLAP